MFGDLSISKDWFFKSPTSFDRTQMAELSDDVIMEKGVPTTAMINSLLQWKLLEYN